jgi:hypothetical protein
MKTQTTTLLNQLSNNEMQVLTNEVKETLATGYQNNSGKVFSAAELWNIQRQRKSIGSRRHFA